MSLFFPKTVEERSASYQQVWGSGGYISPDGRAVHVALGLGPVYAATSLISDQFSALPWALYERTGAVPSLAKQQPQLLTDPSSSNSFDLVSWKHQALASCLLKGNAYGLINQTDSRGVPSDVTWLHPDLVTYDQPADRFYYQGRLMGERDFIHVPGYVFPGSRLGLSPLGLFRVQIETGLEADRFGNNFFKRGGIPTAILKYLKSGLTSEQAQEAQQRFMASVTAQKPFTTGADWDYQALTVPAADAQFLSGVKATANFIASIYKVAPEDIGGEVGGSTLRYASLEMNQINFGIRALSPWTTRFESVLNRYFPPNQYIKFNLDATARADMAARYAAYASSITSGWRAPDEVRQIEELEPLTAAQEAQIMSLRAKPAAPAS